ncbi:sensor histidine kinase [Pendulispora albinea]|uniref:histidine kinase n=1 Tax=Pendulispora albinea TaxID=2741071 RepID=A0ABZ2M379_9BACT
MKVLRAAGVRVRVTFAVTALFGIALVMGALLLVRAVEHTVMHSIEEQHAMHLRALRAQVERGVPLDALLAPPGSPNVTFEVRRPESDPSAPQVLYAIPPLRALPAHPALPPSPTPPTLPPGAADVDWSVTRLPTISPREGRLMLVAASPLDDIRQSVDALRRVLWAAIPALVAAIALGAWWVTGRALSPVRAMTQRVASIHGSTLHERLHVPASGDEIAELAQTMNSMLDRLEQAARRQREFVSDASHELRSPVASIRTQLEVALLHPDPSRWPAVARDVLEEDARLEKLVASLLLLARLDETTTVAQGEVDLDDLVLEHAARPWRLPVDVQRVQAVRLVGDRPQLACVVRNLIENAVRHGKTRVAIATSAGRRTIRLTVDDDGAGIPEAHRTRVFERFTRLEEGRSRDAGGAGLGLSMVQRIVELHGGSVHVECSPLGGARIAVAFPISVPATRTTHELHHHA